MAPDAQKYVIKVFSFYPTALKDCRGIVFTHGVRTGGRREKVCLGNVMVCP